MGEDTRSVKGSNRRATYHGPPAPERRKLTDKAKEALGWMIHDFEEILVRDQASKHALVIPEPKEMSVFALVSLHENQTHSKNACRQFAVIANWVRNPGLNQPG